MLKATVTENKHSIGDYTLIRLIGAGTFSQVYEAKYKENETRVALKIISKALPKSESLHDAEIDALLRLRGHANVVQLLDVFETDTDWIQVLELIKGCDLFKYVFKRKILSEAETFELLRPIASLLAQSHNHHHLAHRDLKLENIMIEEETSRPVLIDFGLAVCYDSLQMTRCGSEEYAAPEIIVGKPYHGERIDVWSFGVIFYACLCGRLPFSKLAGIPVNSSDSKSLYSQILHAEIEISDLSESCQELVSSMLERNDFKRPTFSEIVKRIQ